MVKKLQCDLPKSKGGINYVDLLALAKERNLAIPKRILKRDLCALVNNETAVSFQTLEYPTTLNTAMTVVNDAITDVKLNSDSLTDLNDLYDIQYMIGSGSFGSVWSAVDKISGERVALKLLHSLNDSSKREVAILVNLSKIHQGSCSSNIICYRDQFAANFEIDGQTRPYEIIVTDFVNGVSLDNWLASNGIPSIVILKKWTRQLLAALDLCHANGISHLDVKPSNVMIRNITNDLVLIDFGISCNDASSNQKVDSCKRVSGAGTYVYMSPDYLEHCLKNTTCSEAVRHNTDYWAAALTMFNAAHLHKYEFIFSAKVDEFFMSEVTESGVDKYIKWLEKYITDNPPETGDSKLDAILRENLDKGMSFGKN